MDFSQVLAEKSEAIVQSWVKAVYQDEQIEVTNELTYKAVRDSLPNVLHALATVLSKSQDSDLGMLVDASLKHGTIRAEQGFEPAEIAREYRLLRSIIFSELEPDLLKGSPTEVLRTVRLIDTVIDEAIARCFNSYTVGRLTELSQLQSQLKLTNQELTRLVRASKENLSQLAHELKTPLTSIIGYADLFLRQQRQDPELRDTTTNLESIERVLRNGRLLLRLINDSLEISRFDAGKLVLQPAPTNVRELLNTVLEMVDPLAHAKHLSLAVNFERAPAQVITDPLRLQQVITNLLSNAVRYTDSGTVRLECWQSEQQWAIAISDSGIGIALEDQERIFDPYFQVAAEVVSTQTGGTGLGLAIVSRLVKLLQGEIQLTSYPGDGSTFTVIFPLATKLEAGALSA
ncbi:sensor histidine kinase [Phormidium tenue FACHB-886]|nr:sensor histidine kinase [Phormidium tenue FACHB-886]